MHKNFMPLLNDIAGLAGVICGAIIEQEDYEGLIGTVKYWQFDRTYLPDEKVALYIYDEEYYQDIRDFLNRRSIVPVTWFDLREEDSHFDTATWEGKVDGRTAVRAYTGMLDNLFGYILAVAPHPELLTLVVEAVQFPELSSIGALTRVGE